MTEYSITLKFNDSRDLEPVGQEILHLIIEKYKSYGVIQFTAKKPKVDEDVKP